MQSTQTQFTEDHEYDLGSFITFKSHKKIYERL